MIRSKHIRERLEDIDEFLLEEYKKGKEEKKEIGKHMSKG